MSITSAKTGATGISLALENNFMEPIASTLVGSGGANTVIFNDIPQGYKHLQIRAHSQASYSASDYDNISIRFNGDSGTNYTWHVLRGNGTNVSSGAITSSDRAYAYATHVTNTTDNIYGVGIIDILDYSNTNKYKTVRALGGNDSNGSGAVGITSSLWMSNNSINSITLWDSNTPGTWIQYSRFSLYGIKG
jgi:predicted secreted protein